MDSFRSGEVRLLVATDVAARGLDVKDIAYVINYDFPVDGVEVRLVHHGRHFCYTTLLYHIEGLPSASSKIFPIRPITFKYCGSLRADTVS